MRHFQDARAPIDALRVVGDVLVRDGYAAKFAINEKSKRYSIEWTEKGHKLNLQVMEIVHGSVGLAVERAADVLGDSVIDLAVIEILNGYFKD